MTTMRDPVSEIFDRPAAELLGRARATTRGTWTGTRLGDPGPQTRIWLASIGIDWTGPDNPATANPRGGLDCKDRWTRAFVRALFYQHRAATAGLGRAVPALKVDVGRRLPPLGIFPAGRAVRIRYLAGGRAALRAAAKAPDDERIFTADGDQGGRAGSAEFMDWL